VTKPKEIDKRIDTGSSMESVGGATLNIEDPTTAGLPVLPPWLLWGLSSAWYGNAQATKLGSLLMTLIAVVFTSCLATITVVADVWPPVLAASLSASIAVMVMLLLQLAGNILFGSSPSSNLLSEIFEYTTGTLFLLLLLLLFLLLSVCPTQLTQSTLSQSDTGHSCRCR
jgi:hypothetical protein